MAWIVSFAYPRYKALQGKAGEPGVTWRQANTKKVSAASKLSTASILIKDGEVLFVSASRRHHPSAGIYLHR